MIVAKNIKNEGRGEIWNEIIAFDEKQIYILGTKEDERKFSNFIKKEKI